METGPRGWQYRNSIRRECPAGRPTGALGSSAPLKAELQLSILFLALPGGVQNFYMESC